MLRPNVLASIACLVRVLLVALLLLPFPSFLQAFGNVTNATVFPNTETWIAHWSKDIAPYWLTDDALGDPAGNFPTYRNMRGETTSKTIRYTRMLARQTYAYYVGFNLTGDEKYLSLARKGRDWIAGHAKDGDKGYYTQLDIKGNPISIDKTAQDQAYITNTFAMDYYITRDQRSREAVDQMIALIFNGKFRDEQTGVIYDAMDNELQKDLEFEKPGLDLVTYLDQINAYLLLYTNTNRMRGALSPALANRLRDTCDRMLRYFYADGIFWNTRINRTDYAASHVDTGHTFKAYWMLYRTSKLLEQYLQYPLYQDVLAHVKGLFKDAYGVCSSKCWGMKFSPVFGVVMRNPDWWIQIELNQFAADLAKEDMVFSDMLNQKAQSWLASAFVDKRSPHGVRSGILLNGAPYPGEDESWTNKAFEWKNGYHESEHCLILHIASHAIAKKQLKLYFAVPPGVDAGNFKPYIFNGVVGKVEELGPISGQHLNKIGVSFYNVD